MFVAGCDFPCTMRVEAPIDAFKAGVAGIFPALLIALLSDVVTVTPWSGCTSAF